MGRRAAVGGLWGGVGGPCERIVDLSNGTAKVSSTVHGL